MDSITSTAYSFIESSRVRDRLKAAGVTFSPEQALSLIFNSSRPQEERFPAMLEILSGMSAPQAEELTGILNRLTRLTDPACGGHIRFSECYKANPRIYLTISQLMRSVKRDENRAASFSIISRGRRIAPIVFIDREGIIDIECGQEIGRILSCCPVNGHDCALPEIFAPGETVRSIIDGKRWVVINADITNLGGECDQFDFSAMVVPYEYREFATPELISAHFAERRQDIIAERHEHLYLPWLEPAER